MPEHWNDWHQNVSYEQYKQMPFKLNTIIDLHHIVKEPVPMQPAETRNRCSTDVYFINPAKIVQFARTEGFDYIFCDRFCPEALQVWTQIVKPGAMEEKDPAKRLSMFSVKVQYKARIHVMKSLMLMSSMIHSENEKQGKIAIADAFEGFGNVMHKSIK